MYLGIFSNTKVLKALRNTILSSLEWFKLLFDFSLFFCFTFNINDENDNIRRITLEKNNNFLKNH